MHDNTEKNSPDEKTNRSTGPTSPEGKARSSLNRLTHGCRSEQIIINGEDPAEFEFVMNHWFNAYEPQDPVAQSLLEEVGKAQWMLKRNEKWLHQIQRRLPVDAWTWTDEHHKLLANATRYKTTAERSFYRAFNNLEAYYKRQADKAAQAQKARAQMAKTQMQWLKNKAAASAKELRRVQMVEVTANSRGECVTTCAPTNDQLIALASQSDDPPEFLTRFVFFTVGVPPAYDWLNPNHIQVNEYVIGVQQFTWAGWLRQIEVETNSGTGHLEPYATGLLVE
jgi:hypothetical protein